MNKQNIIHLSKIAPNPLEVEYWADLTVDPNGKVIKSWNGSEWIEITDHLDEINELYRTINGKYDELNRKWNETSSKITGVLSAASNALSNASRALDMAYGKSLSIVFDTVDLMKTFLTNSSNRGALKVGDNIFIKDLNVPDYWVSKTLNSPATTGEFIGSYYEISQLEAAKFSRAVLDSFIMFQGTYSAWSDYKRIEFGPGFNSYINSLLKSRTVSASTPLYVKALLTIKSCPVQTINNIPFMCDGVLNRNSDEYGPIMEGWLVGKITTSAEVTEVIKIYCKGRWYEQEGLYYFEFTPYFGKMLCEQYED